MPLGVIVPWPGTNASIPSGWTRETTLDARFVKMIATSATNPGATGGSATHQHALPAHSHTGGTHAAHTGGTTNTAPTNSTSQSGNLTVLHATVAHTHTFTIDSGTTAATANDNGGVANFDAATSEPPYFEVIFIKSDGTPTGVPNGAIAYWNTVTAPTGWRACDGAAGAPDVRNRFLKGAAGGGNGGATGGTSDAHPHSASHGHASGGTHTHGQTYASSAAVGLEGANLTGFFIAPRVHGHNAGVTGTASPAAGASTGAVANGDATPPWTKSYAIQNNVGAADMPLGMIAIWTGTLATIPAGWRLCDGTLSTPNLSNGSFVRALNVTGELGTTGGALTHTHGAGAAHTHTFASHTHAFGTSGTDNSGNVQNGNNAEDQPIFNHTHSATGSTGADTATSGGVALTAAANTDNRPVYTEVAYIQLYDRAPDAPTINSPLGGVAYSGSVTLSATVTDPDADNCFATFEYDRNDNNWIVIGVGATVASGSASTRSWDISLFAPGYNYRVRAKATDAIGVVGAYSSPTSTFIIGPGFAGLFADDNTSRYVVDDNTTSYYAANNTTTYRAEKN